MRDETYLYIQDVKDKKVTARSARHMRTHTGRGGRVRLPSDSLSKKELNAMNGECKTYRLNEPMTWDAFKSLPNDVKVMYITALRSKYGVPNNVLANLWNVSVDAVWLAFKKLGLPGMPKGKRKWDEEGFYTWWNGIPQSEPVILSEEEVSDNLVADDKRQLACLDGSVSIEEEPVASVEHEPDNEQEVESEKPTAGEVSKMFQMQCDMEYLRRENEKLTRENEKLKAQLEIVHLIFGGRQNA